MAQKHTTTNTTQLSYAQLMLELNELVGQLETPDIDVDEAIKLYERGLELTKQLDSYLTEREHTLSSLKKSATKPKG